ncbi:hypothetical protein MNB_SV-15-1114 [hydrothermal vent metagenome]|uniref:Uncharacterized protein n=1 Tax=hydrothermal vent metagenome TaxID=652676 RepID=A0A1W1EKZ0_9ZZZZ
MLSNFRPSKIRKSKYYLETLLNREKSFLPQKKRILEEKKPKSIIKRLFGWIFNS